MDFSFECGGCNAVYKLDNDQISTQGVKITCPRCMSFFLLRKGSTQAAAPMIERLASKDGAFQVTTPPPKRGEVTTDILMAESDDISQAALLERIILDPTDPGSRLSALDQEKTSETHTTAKVIETTITLPPHPIPAVTKPPMVSLSQTTSYASLSAKEEKVAMPTPSSLPPLPKRPLAATNPALKITEKDLSDYPSDNSQPSKFEKWLIPAGLGTILFLGILFGINYIGLLKIPGLESLRKTPPSSVIKNLNKPDATTTPKAVYGFPKLEEMVPPTPSVEPLSDSPQ